jgi:hypothetical protein
MADMAQTTKTKEEKLGGLFELLCDDITFRIQEGPAAANPLEGLVNALPFPTAESLVSDSAPLKVGQ